MRSFWKCAIALVLSAAMGQIASAGISWKIDATPGGPNAISVTPGSSGFLTGYVEVTAPELGQGSTTWQSTIAFGGPLANITLGTATTPATSVYGGVATASFSTASERTLSSFVFPATTLTSRTELFRIPYTVSAAATPGSAFTFDIIGNTTAANQSAPTLLTNAAGGTLPSSFAGTEFTINVVAVPEPSTFALLAVAGAGIFAVRRLRKSKAAI